jgi:hypothetical protein
MTLADLCTSLIERESVIHSFPSPLPVKHAPRRRDGRPVPSNDIAAAAEELGTFTRAELQVRTGCTFHAARHWIGRNNGKLIELSHRQKSNGGVAIVWRFR